MLWKNTTPNNRSKFCPNLIFEDDEFKAFNDQVFLKLFIFNLFRLSFNFFNITRIGFVNIKKNVCRHQSKDYFIKCFNLLLYKRTLSQPNSASFGSDLIIGRIPAHPSTETVKALLQAT